jgi:Raf kinase inhibitor-like YbhB/YbcL family protein
MASGISKSAVVCVALGIATACGAEPPGNDGPTAGTSSVGGSSVAGAAGSGGSPAASGSSAGGTVASGGTAGSATAGGGAGGQAQPGAGGGGAGGSASGGAGGSGGTAAGSGGTGGGGGSGGSGAVVPFELKSPAFENVEACSQQNHGACKVFPLKHVMTTIGGQNISPELSWGPGPEGTQSYAITLFDYSNGFTHWAIWNITPATLMLAENLARNSMPATPAGAQQKSFSDADAGYMGPGAKDHVYEFKLYALNTAKFTPNDPNDQVKIYDQLKANAGNFVLKTTTLRGVSPK